MNTSLKYGNQKILITFPETVQILDTNEPISKVNKNLFSFNFKAQLKKQKAIYDNIAIIVGDKTRLCDYPVYLPLLIKALLEEGARKENITFYIAYGTHPKQTDAESLNSYGNIYKEYKFVHHDCNNPKIFKKIGTTSRKTPILIRKDISNSTLIITFGPISHHYFAGFGGGRKLLFPGLGEKNSIYHNHSLFLNAKKKKLEPDCQPGQLEKNPVAEDLKEIDKAFPPKISIHGILNSKGKVNRIYFSKTYEDFFKICKIYNSYYKSKIQKQFDLVIASSGGYPKDINFIQAHKSIHNASAFVKDDGKLLILAECSDGIGNPTFLNLFKSTKNKNPLFNQLLQKYEGNGGTALAMKEKTDRIKIFALTQLSDVECHFLKIKKINKEEISSLITKEKGTIAVIPNASMLIK